MREMARVRRQDELTRQMRVLGIARGDEFNSPLRKHPLNLDVKVSFWLLQEDQVNRSRGSVFGVQPKILEVQQLVAEARSHANGRSPIRRPAPPPPLEPPISLGG
jgi:hypothetical protein